MAPRNLGRTGAARPAEAGRRRETVRDLVYREIRRSLMVGTFAPGEKVSLRSLAEQAGTSLTPVRGTANRLIAEGAFRVLPNRSVVIPPMTEEKFVNRKDRVSFRLMT
jgi:DNA-binding GntR family transcriptional regulator